MPWKQGMVFYWAALISYYIFHTEILLWVRAEEFMKKFTFLQHSCNIFETYRY